YEYKAKVDYEEADWQSKKLPVYIDTTAPEASVTVNEDDNTLEVSLSDEGVGVAFFSVNVDGERLPVEGYFDASETVIDLDEFGLDASEADLIEIIAYDHAYNAGYAISNADDTVKPVIYVDDNGPAALGLYGTNTVPVKGYVVEENLKTLKVNGKEVAFTETEEGFAFDTTIELETGRHDVKFEATDYNGNTSSIIRPIYVDTVNPTLAIDAPGVVDQDQESVEFDITVKDNFNMVKLSLDGDVLYAQDVYDELKMTEEISKTVAAKVDLAPGVNTFTVVAEDGAGNKIEKEVKIDRVDSELRAERISGASRYDTAV